jgi:hypothetical protein
VGTYGDLHPSRPSLVGLYRHRHGDALTPISPIDNAD